MLGVFTAAFLCEFLDSALGMGYGTTLTPVLLLAGFAPLMIIPALLFSQFLSSGFSAYMHHRLGNVEFNFSRASELDRSGLGTWAYLPQSREAKIALLLSICGLVGASVAVLVAINITQFYLELFIGMIILAMGLLILLNLRSKAQFSWKKIMGVGVMAAFNKGISGGGYGPLATSGQVLSGMDSKNSVAITALSESAACVVGVIAYMSLAPGIDWSLLPLLVLGSLLSVPLAATTVKYLPEEKFTRIIGIATTVLGVVTLYEVLI